MHRRKSESPLFTFLSYKKGRADRLNRIDTGASVTCISKHAYWFHCQGYAHLDQRKSFNITGIGGVATPSREKATLTLKVSAGVSTLEVSGDAWVLISLPGEVILGLPFMKENNMHLTFEGGREGLH